MTLGSVPPVRGSRRGSALPVNGPLGARFSGRAEPRVYSRPRYAACEASGRKTTAAPSDQQAAPRLIPETHYFRLNVTPAVIGKKLIDPPVSCTRK